MKKIIICIIVLVGMTGICNADSSNLTTNNYIKAINKSISILQAENGIKQKATIKTLILNGVESGYIKPSLQNEKVLYNSLNTFLFNINNLKVDNIELNKQHDLLIIAVNDLMDLLDTRIQVKTNTLNSQNRLMNIKYILVDDSENINIINDTIDNINSIYKEIKEFNNKFSISKLL